MIKQEAAPGMTGYLNVQNLLRATSEQAMVADKVKGQNLEDISTVVNQITKQLEDKKVSFKPQVSVALFEEVPVRVGNVFSHL